MNKGPDKKKSPKDSDETVRIEPDEVKKIRSEDSEQIERAVYDGMRDLRIKKPGQK